MLHTAEVGRSSSRRKQHDEPIPARGPALPEDRMLVSFDVDCGQMIHSHRFIARGISDSGTMTGPDGTGAFPAFSLQYELVPGVPAEHDKRAPFRWLVGIEYQADVPLPWTPNDTGAIAPFRGGDSTHGSRGTWPLPRTARVLRFVLTGVDGSTGFQRDGPDGVLTVDLELGTAI
jgi:hypothetical protein